VVGPATRSRAAVALSLLSCLATVPIAACGSGATSSSGSHSANVTASDKALLNTLGDESGTFTNASIAWDNAYKSGNITHFLAVERADTARMLSSLNKMTLTSSNIRDPKLRAVVAGLLHAFSQQLTAVSDQDAALRLGDRRASIRATHELNVVRTELLDAMNAFGAYVASVNRKPPSG
jgi:hypothetical protein